MKTNRMLLVVLTRMLRAKVLVRLLLFHMIAIPPSALIINETEMSTKGNIISKLTDF